MNEPYFNKQENTGLRHFFNAAGFSLKGLTQAVLRESAFRQELAVFAILLPSGAYIANSLASFIALVCACLLVLIVELLNSGIEAAIDRIGVEHHELSGLAKDYGSAAVMLSLIMVGAVYLYLIITWLDQ